MEGWRDGGRVGTYPNNGSIIDRDIELVICSYVMLCMLIRNLSRRVWSCLVLMINVMSCHPTSVLLFYFFTVVIRNGCLALLFFFFDIHTCQYGVQPEYYILMLHTVRLTYISDPSRCSVLQWRVIPPNKKVLTYSSTPSIDKGSTLSNCWIFESRLSTDTKKARPSLIHGLRRGVHTSIIGDHAIINRRTNHA